jgi:hypothetical protein
MKGKKPYRKGVNFGDDKNALENKRIIFQY